MTVGGNFEREAEGGWAVGPAASLELPIFDQHQAEIARREALLRKSREQLSALAVAARSEVREAASRVAFARRLAEHARTVVIPMRERIVALSQVEYGAMLLGVYQLLLAKQNEVDAYREYIELVRDYWIARAELGRAVGGRLPAAAAPVAPAPGSPSAPPAAMPHSHGH
jgi:cobalt-zinc-cadmium efflux system outer membrane protein